MEDMTFRREADKASDHHLVVTEEISMAIRQSESEKAAEPDNILAEALKSDIEVTANMLHALFRKIWKNKCQWTGKKGINEMKSERM
ncbi:unnamed protein product [Schistosoma margrebowiei]|uniref:Uncharacterized protein n=1 Tax=Schistosoma margrebowiei TaxID=48269 RepID=A0A183MBR6_9TREM|nr:unnamed protein product [Schistosoma margrebowiei]